MKTIRGQDAHGSGAWQASRGNRKHNGVDIVCSWLDPILSDVNGKVTKLGYPYNPSDKKKGHLRYVEVTDNNKARVRYFYISPDVKKGDIIKKGDQLGLSQNLTTIYPKITQHYHLEVIAYIEPLKYIGETCLNQNTTPINQPGITASTAHWNHTDGPTIKTLERL